MELVRDLLDALQLVVEQLEKGVGLLRGRQVGGEAMVGGVGGSMLGDVGDNSGLGVVVAVQNEQQVLG